MTVMVPEAEQQLRNALFADLDAKQASDWRDDRAAATELLGPRDWVVAVRDPPTHTSTTTTTASSHPCR